MTLRQELRAWILLAIGALAIAGVFALLLALSRTPVVGELFSFVGFFRKALAVHVVFSFVIWFICIFGALLSLSAIDNAMGDEKAGRFSEVALGTTALGALVLMVSPFSDIGEATFSNYIPAITHSIYYTGLGLVGLGPLLVAMRHVGNFFETKTAFSPFGVMMNGAAIAYVLAMFSFLIAAGSLDRSLTNEFYNERLFWGGGHGLQIVNTAALLAVWILLVEKLCSKQLFPKRSVRAVTVLLVGAAFAGPIGYFVTTIQHPDHGLFYTNIFRFSLVVLPVIGCIGIILLAPDLIKKRKDRAFLALVLSLVLFNVGGIFGYLLDGSDTRVPAHYHAMIGGITLVFMAFVLEIAADHIAPPISLTKIKRDWIRLCYWLYGIGQLAHSAGLFVAGRQGVARKTAGAAQGLDSFEKILGMGLTGFGGLIAVVGGVIFIIVAFKYVAQHKISKSSQVIDFK